METKKYTVSCIGVGMRGTNYLSFMKDMKTKYKIVSLCDYNKGKLLFNANEYGVKTENCFTDENEFFKQKRSDLIIISTLDKDHVGHLVKALKAGYKYILVEKPFCTTFKEIKLVLKEKKKHDAKIFVCHVLRYAPAFLTAKAYIDEGKIGKLVNIQATERVGFMHQSHSYVRGHYGNVKTSSPMIMAKCCHDLDLLVWYANSLCESISSYGDLYYFKKENQPKGASSMCKDCKYRGTGECMYDVYKIYAKENGYLTWARPWVTQERPITEEAIIRGLDNGNYGRCAFACGNDVVDNQTVNMQFKNGVTASLLMTALTPRSGRRYVFYGTKGEIILDEYEGQLSLIELGKERQDIEISTLIDAKAGHGGGDKGLVENLASMLDAKELENTSIEFSLESHKMALLAEKSRLSKGKKIKC